MSGLGDKGEYPDSRKDRMEFESTICDKWYSNGSKVERPFFYHNERNERAFVRSLIAKYGITPGSKLIDIGCGNGLYANLFAESGLRVTAVDLSEEAIKYAIAKYGGAAEWISGDAFKLAYDGDFDYGFCNFFNFFNSCDSPSQNVEYSERIMRYIRPRGVMFFIWHSDLTAIRLPDNRFSIMNFTPGQLMSLFPRYVVDSYAIDSLARLPIYLGRFSFNKWITRLSCAIVLVLSSSWRRVRIILAVRRCEKPTGMQHP